MKGKKTIKIDRTEKYDLKDLTKDDWYGIINEIY